MPATLFTAVLSPRMKPWVDCDLSEVLVRWLEETAADIEEIVSIVPLTERHTGEEALTSKLVVVCKLRNR